MRWIAHVDLDAFFTSCEQRDRPEYRGRPVVVGAKPGNRGVVAAASYEARVFGIHSAMPIAEAYRRCPDAVYLKPDMAKYRQASRQVFEILGDITPVVEKASVDEAYLDISGLGKIIGPPDAVGREIRRRVQAGTGLTVSVGIGPNRLIAKLGSEARKPDGLTVIAPDEVLDFLAPMPVGNLRGLGPQTQKIFDRLAIRTVAELRAMPIAKLKEHLGKKAAESFHRQARGIASSDVVPDRGRKSISKETTFGADVRGHDILHDTLRTLGSTRRHCRYTQNSIRRIRDLHAADHFARPHQRRTHHAGNRVVTVQPRRSAGQAGATHRRGSQWLGKARGVTSGPVRSSRTTRTRQDHSRNDRHRHREIRQTDTTGRDIAPEITGPLFLFQLHARDNFREFAGVSQGLDFPP
jgi:nucleotidyltransferase/DNA polymerase involved in DNA repair